MGRLTNTPYMSPNWPPGANWLAHMLLKCILCVPLWLLFTSLSLFLGEFHYNRFRKQPQFQFQPESWNSREFIENSRSSIENSRESCESPWQFPGDLNSMSLSLCSAHVVPLCRCVAVRCAEPNCADVTSVTYVLTYTYCTVAVLPYRYSTFYAPLQQ